MRLLIHKLENIPCQHLTVRDHMLTRPDNTAGLSKQKKAQEGQSYRRIIFQLPKRYNTSYLEVLISQRNHLTSSTHLLFTSVLRSEKCERISTFNITIIHINSLFLRYTHFQKNLTSQALQETDTKIINLLWDLEMKVTNGKQHAYCILQ